MAFAVGLRLDMHDAGLVQFLETLIPAIISSQDSPVGSVPVILAEIMEPGRGKVGLVELSPPTRKLA